jgi:excinuclease ABC subunit A
LQQQRGAGTTRSSVSSVTTLANLLRMLYSRAGDYPRGQPLLYAESFSPNTPEGACPTCHGMGRIYDVTEHSMVPDPSRTIRERAVAAWPQAWGGQNLRDILITLGVDVDRPWRELPRKTRDWILFTDDQPTVPVYAGLAPADARAAYKDNDPPSYMGTFSSARRHVLHSFTTTHSAMMKRRAAHYMVSTDCKTCHGKRLRPEALSIKFANLDIADIARLPLKQLAQVFQPYASGRSVRAQAGHPEKAIVSQRIAQDLVARLAALLELGLGYLTLDRSTPTLSPGELQRLRLATQVRSNLFGVVYVLDEPSAGLHPADTEALLAALDRLKRAGNSLFVVEHDLDVIRRADWIVDVGPAAGEHGGQILYSGPLAGLAEIGSSQTAHYLFHPEPLPARPAPAPRGQLTLAGVTRNNLHGLDVEFPLGALTVVTGVSGSGKSSLVSQALVELVSRALGQALDDTADETEAAPAGDEPGEPTAALPPTGGAITGGLDAIRRLVRVDQKPIGRTPRSNLATYTGLFDHVRQLFAATKLARARHYDAGRFSFNVAKGRCDNCQGEGFVFVEMLFLPSVYAPCPVCRGARYNAKTLEITYRDRTIADVLAMTVDEAWAFFADAPALARALDVVRQVGIGYLRLGQPATELSGGEAQRIKLATELQRAQRGDALYVLDEPTTGLHAADVARLMAQLAGLVAAGNTVIVVEHELRVIAGADHVIDIGPGAGDEGGRIVAAGTPAQLARARGSRTAPYLARFLDSL